MDLYKKYPQKEECKIREKEAKLREKPQQFKLCVVIIWGLRLMRAIWSNHFTLIASFICNKQQL